MKLLTMLFVACVGFQARAAFPYDCLPNKTDIPNMKAAYGTFLGFVNKTTITQDELFYFFQKASSSHVKISGLTPAGSGFIMLKISAIGTTDSAGKSTALNDLIAQDVRTYVKQLQDDFPQIRFECDKSIVLPAVSVGN